MRPFRRPNAFVSGLIGGYKRLDKVAHVPVGDYTRSQALNWAGSDGCKRLYAAGGGVWPRDRAVNRVWCQRIDAI